MKYSAIFLSIAVLFIFVVVSPAQAGECYSQTTHLYAGSANVNSGVFARDGACMDGTTVLGSFTSGSTVTVLAENDGWYKVTNGSVTGWVWGSFLSVSASPTGATESGAAAKMSSEEIESDPVVVEEEPVVVEEPAQTENQSYLETKYTYDLLGHILLQVEEHGEAWYVYPKERRRYYMKDGPAAYEMMRSFGLGITDADLNKLPTVSNVAAYENASSVCATSSLAKQLSGQILLQVEQHGEAWYVDPRTCLSIYMEDGAAAYEIMRYRGLGITNKDLSYVLQAEITPIPYGADEDPVAGLASSAPITNFQNIRISASHEGVVPSKVNLVALNEYWLSEVNALRAKEGLRQLVLDQRFVDTASEYAAYMYLAQAYAHERANGGSMHDWIDEQGLDFTLRYSLPDGWVANYFTENISWGYSDNSQSGALTVLDQSMSYYLGEASYNGPHYRTIYHEDWNTVGLGFYFEPLGGDDYKVYVTMHYGSLEK